MEKKVKAVAAKVISVKGECGIHKAGDVSRRELRHEQGDRAAVDGEMFVVGSRRYRPERIVSAEEPGGRPLARGKKRVGPVVSGVIDQDVDPAERRFRPFHEPTGVFRIGQVRFPGFASGAEGVNGAADVSGVLRQKAIVVTRSRFRDGAGVFERPAGIRLRR